ncbi:hypothetical protein BJX64DRAFT_220476 [Aspergillus heterothallicus]
MALADVWALFLSIIKIPRVNRHLQLCFDVHLFSFTIKPSELFLYVDIILQPSHISCSISLSTSSHVPRSFSEFLISSLSPSPFPCMIHILVACSSEENFSHILEWDDNCKTQSSVRHCTSSVLPDSCSILATSDSCRRRSRGPLHRQQISICPHFLAH